jgi:small-conductance mechanosensitive channel
MDTEQLSAKFLINADKVWQYVVISISNKEIKIANIALAFLAIYLCSKYYKKILHSLLNNLLSDRFLEDRGVIERLLSIFFGSILVILILQISNVPLETFAFLGGAFVLGFGLGIQNIVNNFLSGLILIIEKPINVGDFISIDGCTGVVKEIGGRCITVINHLNAAVIIPNSILVQNKLTNWSRESFLHHAITVKIPKRVNANHNVQECTKILTDIFKDCDLKQDLTAYLLSVTISYYIYSISYKLYASLDESEFKSQINSLLIERLGADIIIESTERPK